MRADSRERAAIAARMNVVTDQVHVAVNVHVNVEA
jgi:hypothetical protein